LKETNDHVNLKIAKKRQQEVAKSLRDTDKWDLGGTNNVVGWGWVVVAKYNDVGEIRQ